MTTPFENGSEQTGVILEQSSTKGKVIRLIFKVQHSGLIMGTLKHHLELNRRVCFRNPAGSGLVGLPDSDLDIGPDL